jgi:hypothetical protein
MDRKVKVLTDYLLLCVELKDWHGVSDAANDLRVLEERLNHEEDD